MSVLYVKVECQDDASHGSVFVLFPGEDRWLCTLLLQQGYRVEYCAAADALTYAPEGFREFFNQRRRWSPSTMANIMDLLQDWRHVIKVGHRARRPTSVPRRPPTLKWVVRSIPHTGPIELFLILANLLYLA